jgi:hypothetical protein
MNRAVTVLALVVLCLLGTLPRPTAAFGDPSLQAELDALMQRWIEALKTEDSATLAECYWPDAVAVSYDPSGGSELLEGRQAIRESQEAVFAEYDYPSLALEYPEPARFFPRSDPLPVYIYNYVDYRFIDIFYFEKRSGEVRILRHVLLVDPQG